MADPADRRTRRPTRFQVLAATAGGAVAGTAALALSGALPNLPGGAARTAGVDRPAPATAGRTASSGAAAAPTTGDGVRAVRGAAGTAAGAAPTAEGDLRRERAADRSAASRTKMAASGPPRDVARRIVGDDARFRCLDALVERESGWNVTARNPGSGAYGLFQALPGAKMAAAGPDWRTNPATQIRWGLAYMEDRYGGPCGAWSFWQRHEWY